MPNNLQGGWVEGEDLYQGLCSQKWQTPLPEVCFGNYESTRSCRTKFWNLRLIGADTERFEKNKFQERLVLIWIIKIKDNNSKCQARQGSQKGREEGEERRRGRGEKQRKWWSGRGEKWGGISGCRKWRWTREVISFLSCICALSVARDISWNTNLFISCKSWLFVLSL